jgi:hypothetical protein
VKQAKITIENLLVKVNKARDYHERRVAALELQRRITGIGLEDGIFIIIIIVDCCAQHWFVL